MKQTGEPSPIMTLSTKNPRLKFIFKVQTTRLHEFSKGLNSSLSQFSAKLWLTKVCPKRPNHNFCATFLFLSKIVVLSHNFCSRSLKTRIIAYFLKKIEPKMAYWVGGQNPVNLVKKAKPCSYCDVTHRKPQTQNIFLKAVAIEPPVDL